MGSGKTQFVMHLVDSADALIEPTPRKIVYYSAKYQPLFEHYDDRIEFRHESGCDRPADRCASHLRRPDGRGRREAD